MSLTFVNRTTAIAHVIGFFILIGYAQEYYFHLRKFTVNSIAVPSQADCFKVTTRTTPTRENIA